jgi:hypothetical protein
MKLADAKLGIPDQIWAVLQLLGGGDYSFFGLKVEGLTEQQMRGTVEEYDVQTFPFYNFEGRAYGFSFMVKHFNTSSYDNKPVLYFTITEHGSSDNICVIDWLGTYSHRNPPMLSKDRPEASRCAFFNYGQVGDVVQYVRTLIAYYLAGKAGTAFRTNGVIGIENADSEYGKRVL